MSLGNPYSSLKEVCESYLPVTVALNHHARNLEKTVWAVPANYLLDCASRTSDLLAVFAVEEVLYGVQGEVGAW